MNCPRCGGETVYAYKYVSYDYEDEDGEIVEGDDYCVNDCIPYCPSCLEEC